MRSFNPPVFSNILGDPAGHRYPHSQRLTRIISPRRRRYPLDLLDIGGVVFPSILDLIFFSLFRTLIVPQVLEGQGKEHK